jgi:hypothetical protein
MLWFQRSETLTRPRSLELAARPGAGAALQQHESTSDRHGIVTCTSFPTHPHDAQFEPWPTWHYLAVRPPAKPWTSPGPTCHRQNNRQRFFPHLTSVKQVSSARIFEQFRRSILLLLMMLLGAWTGTVQLFTHRRMSAVTTHAARALEINNYGPAEKLITYCNTRSLVSLCCDRR